jgi:hypothetical protein
MPESASYWVFLQAGDDDSERRLRHPIWPALDKLGDAVRALVVRRLDVCIGIDTLNILEFLACRPASAHRDDEVVVEHGFCFAFHAAVARSRRAAVAKVLAGAYDWRLRRSTV